MFSVFNIYRLLLPTVVIFAIAVFVLFFVLFCFCFCFCLFVCLFVFYLVKIRTARNNTLLIVVHVFLNAKKSKKQKQKKKCANVLARVTSGYSISTVHCLHEFKLICLKNQKLIKLEYKHHLNLHILRKVGDVVFFFFCCFFFCFVLFCFVFLNQRLVLNQRWVKLLSNVFAAVNKVELLHDFSKLTIQLSFTPKILPISRYVWYHIKDNFLLFFNNERLKPARYEIMKLCIKM